MGERASGRAGDPCFSGFMRNAGQLLGVVGGVQAL